MMKTCLKVMLIRMFKWSAQFINRLRNCSIIIFWVGPVCSSVHVFGYKNVLLSLFKSDSSTWPRLLMYAT